MTEKCVDSGTMQAFLDGELDFEQTETVAEHVGACDECAMQLAVAEEETAMAFSALEQEFNTLVPTQRLWTKINDSIEQERERKSFWTPIFAFFRQPAIVAFAGLLIVAALFAVLLNRGTTEENQTVAEIKINSNEKAVEIPVLKPAESNLQTLPLNKNSEFIAASNVKNKPFKLQFGRANTTAESTNRNVKFEKRELRKDVLPPLANESLTGEDSYIKTIATLTETVNDRKDEVLKPSARFAFERDLAVADDAISTMKKEVKRNPQDESAKEVLRASYQNKIDLLNSVADKTDLMASVR